VADGLTRGARPWSRARARARLSVAAATLRRFANIGAIGRRQAEDGPLQWDQIGCAADDTRGAGVERRYGFAGGKSSEGENPTSVTGMKQGRRDQEGANRQEVEKTWRRNVPGQATPGGQWISCSSCAEGERNLMGGTANAAAVIAVACGWSSSEGEATPRADRRRVQPAFGPWMDVLDGRWPGKTSRSRLRRRSTDRRHRPKR
jgi:hypothetical protein